MLGCWQPTPQIDFEELILETQLLDFEAGVIPQRFDRSLNTSPNTT